MRTSTDVLRSISKYMAESLGSEWEVRFEDEEGAFGRPFCRVQTATPLQTSVHPPVITCRQTFSIVCYPVEKEQPVEARLEAARVEELLIKAFTVGTKTSAFGRKQNSGLTGQSYQRGHPLRIPLYNYDGVAITASVTEAARDPRDFVRVIDQPGVQTLEGTSRAQEPEQLYVVTADVRVEWTRTGAVLTPGEITDEVHLHLTTP